MRETLLVGAVLTLAAAVLVGASAAFDLDLESVALLGASVGAVIALVPDRSPLVRLAGFAGGVLAALIGYLLRAALLPDSAGGRAVTVVVVLLLCVVLTAASRNRLPLWSTLLGTAALAGAYEFTYAAAPPEVASTSVSAVTTLLFTAAFGFLAVALVSPDHGTASPALPPTRRRRSGTADAADGSDDTDRTGGSGDDDNLDDLMMEKTK
jgi:hypothetical protein